MSSIRRTIGGWGRYPMAETDLSRAESIAELQAIVSASRSVILRGLGRSYGDAAQNGAGVTLLTDRLDRVLDFDEATGVVTCEPGVTMSHLLDTFVPLGFFPPVTPGTKFVTIGGAIANDVHGKNHHVDGSIGRHVVSFRLLMSSGEILECSRDANADVFWATLGGVGLTGAIVQVSLRMATISSAYVSMDVERAADLDAALRLFEYDVEYAYSVAWIDCMARGRGLGRSVLMRGNNLSATDLPPALAANPFARPRTHSFSVPLDFPSWALSPWIVRAFNSAYYRKAPRRATGLPTALDSFFYPLDAVREWNRVYGRRGFYQYQCQLPPRRGREGLVRLLDCISQSQNGGFLAVLKRFGAAERESLLSFPRPGYTLAVDIRRRGDEDARLFEALDRIVIEYGGRVYLAKDSMLRPDAFRAMYPEWPRWRAIRERVDPGRRFTSDLSRRLRLDG